MKLRRKPVPGSVRDRVIRRDNGVCRYCGCVPMRPQIDHVVPVALGGSNDPSNLTVACPDCNGRKGAIPLDDVSLPALARAIMLTRIRSNRCPFHGRQGLQIGPWSDTEPAFTLSHCGVIGCLPWREYDDGTCSPSEAGDVSALGARLP